MADNVPGAFGSGANRPLQENVRRMQGSALQIWSERRQRRLQSVMAGHSNVAAPHQVAASNQSVPNNAPIAAIANAQPPQGDAAGGPAAWSLQDPDHDLNSALVELRDGVVNIEAAMRRLFANPNQLPQRDERRQWRKTGLRNPDNFKDEMVSWRADQLLLRAKRVYRIGQVDGTKIWSPNQGEESKDVGFSVSDGIDSIWFVPTNLTSVFPDSLPQPAKNRFLQRIDALLDAQDVEDDTRFPIEVAFLIEEEARIVHSRLQPNVDWNQVRASFSLCRMIGMLAEARLISGRIPLPGYYRAMILELQPYGKLCARYENIPRHASWNEMVAQLNVWSPHDSSICQQTMKAADQKIRIAKRYGTDSVKRNARELEKELEKSTFNPSEDGGSWYFKFHVKPNFCVRPGKLPAGIREWTHLKDQASLNTIEDEILKGKHGVFTRRWKIHLRRLWPQLDQLCDNLQTIAGEPILTDEQLQVVNSLLAEQSEEERRLGQAFAQVLHQLERPTFGFEFPEGQNDQQGNGDE